MAALMFDGGCAYEQRRVKMYALWIVKPRAGSGGHLPGSFNRIRSTRGVPMLLSLFRKDQRGSLHPTFAIGTTAILGFVGAPNAARRNRWDHKGRPCGTPAAQLEQILTIPFTALQLQ
jgi:hypothetical protein